MDQVFIELDLNYCSEDDLTNDGKPGPLCQQWNNFYYNITMSTQMLPLFATVGGMLAKIHTVIAQIIPEDMGPDLGIGACMELFSSGSVGTAKGDALTELGLVLGTAEGGDAAAAAATKGGELKDGRRSRREELHATRQAHWRDTIKDYAEQTSMLHRTRAYRGEPYTRHEKQRQYFLLPIQVVEQALVMRHYPVGKGFLVRVTKEQVELAPRWLVARKSVGSSRSPSDERLLSLPQRAIPVPTPGARTITYHRMFHSQVAEVEGIGSPDTRPLYLFVKCWSLKHRDGLVLTTYDARDVGFALDKVRTHHHEGREPR